MDMIKQASKLLHVQLFPITVTQVRTNRNAQMWKRDKWFVKYVAIMPFYVFLSYWLYWKYWYEYYEETKTHTCPHISYEWV